MRAFVTALFALSLAGAAAAQTIAPRAPVPAPVSAAEPAKVTETSIERKGDYRRDTFLGVYLTLDRDCKVGETPRIETVESPQGGKMRTRPHPINLRDVPGAPRRNCIGTSPGGLAVLYRPDRKFKGQDKVVFRVLYPNGDRRTVTATLTVE